MESRNSTRWRTYPARQIQQHVRAGPQCKPQGSHWNRRNENGTYNSFMPGRRNHLHTTYQQRIQQSSCKQCGKPCSNSFSNIHMCPAKFASCNKCGNYGHFARMCYTKLNQSSRRRNFQTTKIYQKSNSEKRKTRSFLRFKQFKERKHVASNLPFHSVENPEFHKLLNSNLAIKEKLQNAESKVLNFMNLETNYNSIQKENIELNAKLNKVNAEMDQLNSKCEKKMKDKESEKTFLFLRNFKLEEELDAKTKNEENLISKIQMLETKVSSMTDEMNFLDSENNRLRYERNNLRRSEDSLVNEVHELQSQLCKNRNNSRGRYQPPPNQNRYNGPKNYYR